MNLASDELEVACASAAASKSSAMNSSFTILSSIAFGILSPVALCFSMRKRHCFWLGEIPDIEDGKSVEQVSKPVGEDASSGRWCKAGETLDQFPSIDSPDRPPVRTQSGRG